MIYFIAAVSMRVFADINFAKKKNVSQYRIISIFDIRIFVIRFIDIFVIRTINIIH